MFRWWSLLMLIGTSPTWGQIYFQEIPKNFQLIPRDLKTNTGNVQIKGYFDKRVYEADSICVDVYRELELFEKHSRVLEYDKDRSYFDLTFEIPSELANYNLSIYVKSKDQKKTEYKVLKLVCGDVFLINGQSNAMAKRRDEKAFKYESEFIRSYGCGSDNPDLISKSQDWYLAKADASSDIRGNIGQWGIYFARLLIDSLKVPVAILNGANGGMPLNSFSRKLNYHDSDSSNYGRLYRRTVKAGVNNHIRAIFWSQGEQDGTFKRQTSSKDYMHQFTDLIDSWDEDFPSLEKIYIFQTKPGCGDSLHHIMPIIDAQYRMKTMDDRITIIPTSGIEHFKDTCHFNFEKGYKIFGVRLFQQVISDLYDQPNDFNIPYVISFKLKGDKIILYTSVENIELKGNVFGFQLHSDLPISIKKIHTNGPNIVVQLSEKPSKKKIWISYLGEPAEGAGFIGSNGIELVSFYQKPFR